MADHAPHPAPLAACPNCGASFADQPAPPDYCPRCGQRTLLHPPSVAEFAHEFVGHYVALEGALWRTLRLLVVKPGQLTKEYLAGRRAHYVLPLRLYLTASFLFFLVAKLGGLTAFGLGNELQFHTGRAAASAALAGSAPAVVLHRSPEVCDQPGLPECTWLDHRMARSRHELEANPQRSEADFKKRFMSAAPYAVFLMLPFFAATLALAYRSRRMLFGEHLVCCMHLTTLWFLAATVAAPLPEGSGLVLFMLALVHAPLALHAVYGGSWVGTLLRSAAVALVYGSLLIAMIVITTIAVAFE